MTCFHYGNFLHAVTFPPSFLPSIHPRYLLPLNFIPFLSSFPSFPSFQLTTPSFSLSHSPFAVGYRLVCVCACVCTYVWGGGVVVNVSSFNVSNDTSTFQWLWLGNTFRRSLVPQCCRGLVQSHWAGQFILKRLPVDVNWNISSLSHC